MFKSSLLASILVISSSLAPVFACSADLKVQDEWVAQPPGGSDVAAAYLQIANSSADAHRLVKAASDCCEAVELHQNEDKDGVMKMREADGVAIPPKGEAEFKPGGNHIMLIGLKKPLKTGDKVSIDLTFEDGQTFTHSFPVKSRP